MKERYGFIDEEVTVENENSEEESKGVLSEKNNGSEKGSTENTTESTPLKQDILFLFLLKIGDI